MLNWHIHSSYPHDSQASYVYPTEYQGVGDFQPVVSILEYQHDGFQGDHGVVAATSDLGVDVMSNCIAVMER